MLGQKPNLSKRIREMRASIALQGLARTFYSKPEEEKFNENRELLPQLREAVQEDTRVLGRVRKVPAGPICCLRDCGSAGAAEPASPLVLSGSRKCRAAGGWDRPQPGTDVLSALLCPQHELTLSEACAAEQPLGIALASKTVEVAQEKLRAEIYGRVNTCNMLLYQVKQRSRAKEQLQRRLQQLQDVRMDEKQHQAQVVRTLESSIEKTQTKVHAGQKVTALYVAVRDALRKELAHLPLHLDVLSETAELQHGEVEDMELRASHGLRAARVAKEHKARMEAQFRAERELRARTLAARKERVDRRWLKEAEERLLKAQARHDVARDLLSLPEQDPLGAAKPEATKSRLERDAWLTEKMEKAKAAVQCSCLWDVPGRLLAQQKSLAALEQYLRGRQEKQQELKKALKELEMQRDELKFRQPADTSRCCWAPDSHAKGATSPGGRGACAWGLEEELRTRLQWEEARLAERRARLLRSQETLLDFANGLDSLWGRLRGITVPGQEHSVKAVGAHEKLQQCEQKLQYLVQRVAHLPPCSHSEDDETFVKVRQLLEKTLLNEPQNQKVSLEDVCMRVQGRKGDTSHSNCPRHFWASLPTSQCPSRAQPRSCSGRWG
ncbi:coiled-coil domain-containing protein 183-like [Lathamus discolor]|uniref:coiled-coil domain-containing protein 183-like n=1 Tax=Lathamus discolor TaxID=678569 RepID=UPI0032B7A97E